MKAIFFWLALLPGSALAMSAQDYLDHCRTKTVYGQAQCMGYLDALIRRDVSGSAWRATQKASGKSDSVRPVIVDEYCLPNGTQLPLLRDVVVRMLERMPAQRLAGDASPLIRGVLRRTYPGPCER